MRICARTKAAYNETDDHYSKCSDPGATRTDPIVLLSRRQARRFSDTIPPEFEEGGDTGAGIDYLSCASEVNLTPCRLKGALKSLQDPWGPSSVEEERVTPLSASLPPQERTHCLKLAMSPSAAKKAREIQTVHCRVEHKDLTIYLSGPLHSVYLSSARFSTPMPRKIRLRKKLVKQ